MRHLRILSGEQLKYGLIFGAIASLLNAIVLIPLYGQLSFHFGQVAVFVCLVARGLGAGLVAVFPASAVLAVSMENPVFLVLMPLEMVVVYWFRQRGLELLLGDFLYWLLVGVPLSLLLILWRSELPVDFTTLLLLKQVLNGALYTLIASIVVMFLPERLFSGRGRGIYPGLSSRIFYLLNISIVLSALLVALTLTSRNVAQIEKHMQRDFRKSAKNIASVSGDYLAHHVQVIRHLAKSVEISDGQENLVRHAQREFPGFITTLIAGRDGGITFGAPTAFYQRMFDLPEAHRSVADRDYFEQARATGEAFVSDVFRGRGFGDDPIVAISSPVYEGERFNGIVEGSLDLSAIEQLAVVARETGGDWLTVITDSKGLVIFASAATGLDLLEEFIPEGRENRYSKDLALATLKDSEYLYHTESNDFGWRVYTLVSPSVIIGILIESIVILALCVLVISAIFLVVSRRFSRQITEPLVQLTRRFGDESAPLSLQDSAFVSDEVRTISVQLQRARDLMLDFNKQLEQQVETKTAELAEANEKLAQLARQDALTGLANRRSFDEQARRICGVNARNKQPLSLAFIDADHFKSINDRYGHPFGDKVIVELAGLIAAYFSRSTDISARYGGEEFVLLLAAGTCESHIKQLEAFRAGVEHRQVGDGEATLTVTVSIGVVCVEQDFNLGFDSLVHKADELLYKSKAAGRNRVSSMVI